MRADGPVVAFVNRIAGRLRFPHLFLIVALLFLADLVVPDLLPFADEILLGLATLLLARWKERSETPAETG